MRRTMMGRHPGACEKGGALPWRGAADPGKSQPGESTTPMRVEVVLGRGQNVILSTPHQVGVAPELVEISRQADTVLLRKLSGAVTN